MREREIDSIKNRTVTVSLRTQGRLRNQSLTSWEENQNYSLYLQVTAGYRTFIMICFVRSDRFRIRKVSTVVGYKVQNPKYNISVNK